MKNIRTWKNYLYIAPAVILVLVFFITSIIYTIRLSFFEWDGFSPMRFIGLQNYINLFNDPNFIISSLNTIIWVASSLILSLAIPLFVAILVMKSSWMSGFKNILYFPTALSATVVGVIMAQMVSKFGVPQLLGLMGFESLVRDWLAVPYVNTAIMIVIGTWQGLGLNMVLFIAGLNNIPQSPIEAARIEGAGTFALYTRVIFPLLKPTTIVVLLMALVNSFKVFDSIWVMTRGGPFRTSETLGLTMYIESFTRSNFGLGAAVAVVLTVVILFVSYFNLRNTFRDSDLI
jgi:multiple sugar transport system permease protein